MFPIMKHPSIQIGLSNLREIQRGNVHIGKCPNLCYVHTVNWTALGTSLSTYADIPKCQNEECAPDCEATIQLRVFEKLAVEATERMARSKMIIVRGISETADASEAEEPINQLSRIF
ncbi:hypothetical protein HHI36_010450 [Cryptolaemus montrouzieri]|uniref:Receptor L-domain domain-containing protein n=1 Tax=Cryptolaemus montrouzieri TaxID=559131 RepID=A0ABD2MIR6_9CUCU